MAEAIKVPTMAEFMAQGKSPEVLFWVGCAGSFDDRAKKMQNEPVTNFYSKCRR